MNAVASPDISMAAFESGTVDPDRFDHEAHLYLAWSYLENYVPAEAIARCAGTLKRLTRKLGNPGKYHQTITWFFLLLIAERRAKTSARSWVAFREANGDLLECSKILSRYYSQDVLQSNVARTTFVLPDKIAG